MQANRYKIEKFLKPNASLIAKYFHIFMSLFSNKKNWEKNLLYYLHQKIFCLNYC